MLPSSFSNCQKDINKKKMGKRDGIGTDLPHTKQKKRINFLRCSFARLALAENAFIIYLNIK